LKSVHTSGAPAAIGPYSQGVVAGGLVFVSGQIALDPATGRIEAGGAGAETERVLRNIAAILEAAGSSFGRVLRTTVYLTRMEDFEEMNTVYARFLGAHRPARATVQVAGLPRGVSIEIDAIALAGEG